MLQEPRQLVVCNNHSGVCRWQCLSWCSPRLASLRLVFQCFHKPKRVSIHLFYFFPREASDPEDTCLAVGPAPEWCRSPLGSPTRFARCRSAISLATRSNHSTEPHSPRGLHFAIYRQSSLDENFQRALVRPLQAKIKNLRVLLEDLAWYHVSKPCPLHGAQPLRWNTFTPMHSKDFLFT